MIYELDTTTDYRDVRETYLKGWRDGHSAAGRSGIAAFVTGFLLASLIGIVLFVALLVAPAAASRSALESSPVEEAGFRAAQGPSEVPSTVEDDGSFSPAPTPSGVGETDIGTAIEAGLASWYEDPRKSGLYAAMPGWHFGDRPYTVRVCRQDGPECVSVTVSDACGCPGDRIIDLSPAAFRRLAPLSVGLVPVTVESGGPTVTPPATSTEEMP